MSGDNLSAVDGTERLDGRVRDWGKDGKVHSGWDKSLISGPPV